MIGNQAVQDLRNGIPTSTALQGLQILAASVAAVDTCYEEDRPTWSKNDPLEGHCGALATTARYVFGGEVLSGRSADGVRWLWNRLPSGEEVALTEDDLIPCTKKGRVFTGGSNSRFAIFCARVMQALARE